MGGGGCLFGFFGCVFLNFVLFWGCVLFCFLGFFLWVIFISSAAVSPLAVGAEEQRQWLGSCLLSALVLVSRGSAAFHMKK